MFDLSLADFLHLSDSEKVALIGDRAILYAQQFGRSDLDDYCELAEICRSTHRTREGRAFIGELLRYRPALNFFMQASSRTFLSFNSAQAFLGMSRMSVRDAKISSMSKGETLVDSVRTFISYVDLVVMRHGDSNAAPAAFWTAMKAHRRVDLDNGESVPVPIISGGSGTEQHPTQALLDVYTLQKSLGSIDHKKIMLVGDLARGRTVRSLSYLMKNYEGVELYFAAPERYQMKPDICEFLEDQRIPYHKLDSISAGIDEVDAVYMTRIQDEYGAIVGEGHEKADDSFIFTMEHLHKLKPGGALLHPLPKRDEIVEEIDYVEDPRVAYWRQERNGMWMRVAIIAKLFKIDAEIRAFAQAR